MTGGKVPSRLSELDGFRALAILMVIAFHSWFFLSVLMTSTADYYAAAAAIPWWLSYVRRGDLGVDIFFVLSGFLLGRQLLAQQARTGQLNYRRYFVHRLLRIYPLYLVALAITVVVSGPTWALLGNIFAYNIWLPEGRVIIPWTWSLSVELEFYLVIPVLILAISSARSMQAVALASVAISAGWALYWVLSNPDLRSHTLMQLDALNLSEAKGIFYQRLYWAPPLRFSQFVAGIAAAWLVLFRADRLAALPRRAIIGLGLLAAAGILLPAMHNPFVPQTPGNRVFMLVDYVIGRSAFAAGMALSMVLMLSGHLGWLRRVLGAGMLKPVARYSYSMYLFHPVFMYPAALIVLGKARVSHVAGWQVVAIFVLTVAATLVFGALTWRLIEHPAIRFGKRRFDSVTQGQWS